MVSGSGEVGGTGRYDHGQSSFGGGMSPFLVNKILIRPPKMQTIEIEQLVMVLMKMLRKGKGRDMCLIIKAIHLMLQQLP